VIALVLAYAPGPMRAAIAGALRDSVLRPIFALQRGASEHDARFSDPVRLRAERDSLASYLVGTATLAAENRQLRELLGLGERLAPGFVPAEIVHVPGRAADGLFRLTVGRADGVEPGAPIVAASGLVGVVRSVDEHGAVGIDWTNPDFGASAMTVDGEVFGIVRPRAGKGGEEMLVLSSTAFHLTLPDTALIVTSGRGGVYPRGIPIGRVVGTDQQEGGWQKSYLIRPLVSPGEMAYVLVLRGRAPAIAGRDLAASWGIRVAEPPPPGDTAVLDYPASLRTPSAAPTRSAPVLPELAPAARPAGQPQLRTQPVRPTTGVTGDSTPRREERR